MKESHRENLPSRLGPAKRGTDDNSQTVTIDDAFRLGSPLTHTGDFVLENTLDGFDRVILATDAVGGVIDTGNGGSLATPYMDPDGRVIFANTQGTPNGATPADRNGTNNVEWPAPTPASTRLAGNTKPKATCFSTRAAH